MPVSDFEDQFSKQADRYRKFRPGYPDELFEYIIALCPGRTMAWDCATGNGQAAAKLTGYFDHVIATDASSSQINNALDLDSVEFRVATAEASGLDSASADLVTVANALHWFDKERFFQESARVLKPGGILACWCYEAFQTDPQYKDAFSPIYSAMDGHWSTKLRDVREHYQNIDFGEYGLTEVEARRMQMSLDWDLFQCLGFLRSWSACQNYIDSIGSDPTEQYFDHARAIWGDAETKRQVFWNIHLKLARKTA